MTEADETVDEVLEELDAMILNMRESMAQLEQAIVVERAKIKQLHRRSNDAKRLANETQNEHRELLVEAGPKRLQETQAKLGALHEEARAHDKALSTQNRVVYTLDKSRAFAQKCLKSAKCRSLLLRAQLRRKDALQQVSDASVSPSPEFSTPLLALVKHVFEDERQLSRLLMLEVEKSDHWALTIPELEAKGQLDVLDVLTRQKIKHDHYISHYEPALHQQKQVTQELHQLLSNHGVDPSLFQPEDERPLTP